MVLRRCQHLLRDEALARDTTQDVFVALCKKQSDLQDRGLSSLLYRMATNLSLNQIRRFKVRKEDPACELLHQIAVANERLDERSEARSLIARLFAVEQQEVGVTAVLHWVDGMTLQEVAREQGISVSGVRKRLAKLRSKMDALQDATNPGDLAPKRPSTV